MFFFDLGPTLSGALLGITFGLLCGVSREERVKQIAVSVFGAIIVAFLGINLYVYGYSLDVFLEFIFWACVGFIPTFLIGLAYRRRRDKPYIGFLNLWGPSPSEIAEIQRNAPKIDPNLKTAYNLFLGLKIVILLKIQNTSEDTLDKLYASLKISDLGLKKKEKERFKDLPNLVPKEEREYTITERIWRSGNYAIDLRIIRNRVLLGEFHWTTKRERFSGQN